MTRNFILLCHIPLCSLILYSCQSTMYCFYSSSLISSHFLIIFICFRLILFFYFILLIFFQFITYSFISLSIVLEFISTFIITLCCIPFISIKFEYMYPVDDRTTAWKQLKFPIHVSIDNRYWHDNNVVPPCSHKDHDGLTNISFLVKVPNH